MYELKLLVQAVVLPPMAFVLAAAAAGALLASRRTRAAGAVLMALAVAGSAALSTLAVSGLLMRTTVEDGDLLDPAAIPADAAGIVVLTGGNQVRRELGGRVTPAWASLARGEYAAWLRERTGLPIAVLGGAPFGQDRSEAEVLAETLRDRLRVEVAHEIRRGRDTIESMAALREAVPDWVGRPVVLVTDAAHMPRAAAEAENAGFLPVRAPSSFPPGPCYQFSCFVPTAGAMYWSSVAANHWLGYLVARLR